LVKAQVGTSNACIILSSGRQDMILAESKDASDYILQHLSAHEGIKRASKYDNHAMQSHTWS